MRGLVLALASVLALAACGGETGSGKLSQPDLVARVTKSSVEVIGRVQFESAIRSGTGVVIDANKGFVLTNAHVVTGVAALKVLFPDGSDSPARVVAKDPCEDLAVLKIVNKPDKLQALTIGDSTQIRAGEHVTAIGYPASFQIGPIEKATATEGSVSVADVQAEPDASLPKYRSLIQHQAPINPGNSGGPLVNDKGELVGINTLGNTLQGGRIIQGQFYAISSREIKAHLGDLEAGHSANDLGWNLVTVDQGLITDLHNRLNTFFYTDVLPDGNFGMLVIGVDTGSPADKGGAGSGYDVFRLEGTPAESLQNICDVLQAKSPGQAVKADGYSVFGPQGKPADTPVEMTLNK